MIYHIEPKEAAVLYQLKDGRFQIVKPGPLPELMVGYEFVLVTKKIADKLIALDIDKIRFEEAEILDPASNETNSGYMKLVVETHFDASMINDMNTDNHCFLVMHNLHLFVTSALKRLLQSEGFDFEFSEGLSRFA